MRLVVIGGGAAGFFCAVNAARMNPSLEVIILEKTNKLLSKVKVSGGGRCNVTHACFEISDMIRHYPRGANFLKKAFHQFFTTDTIEWFRERNVQLKTEPDGRMFPVTNSSQTIIDCLMKEVDKYKVEVRMRSEVKSVKYEGGKFLIELSGSSLSIADSRLPIHDSRLTADFVLIASGGYPKTSMFDWLKNLGHSIEEPVPSLFTFNMPGNAITSLMGVSVSDAQVKITGSKLSARGPLLITHWGMSGPCILRLSAWGARELAAGSPAQGGAGYRFSMVVNWIIEYNENTLRERFQQQRGDTASQKIISRSPFGLPQRLWQYLAEQSGINADTRWADLASKDQNTFIKNCCTQEFIVNGKTTFKEEFVTCGGISLQQIDANTMQSKLIPNLFFAGEVMDVDGITGGFNFQHAWTSGFVAAKAIAGRES